MGTLILAGAEIDGIEMPKTPAAPAAPLGKDGAATPMPDGHPGRRHGSGCSILAEWCRRCCGRFGHLDSIYFGTGQDERAHGGGRLFPRSLEFRWYRIQPDGNAVRRKHA